MRRPRRVSRSGRTRPVVAAVLSLFFLPPAVLAETGLASVQAAIDAWRAEQETAILEDFIELLSLPNVASSVPDMQRNAEYIVGLLEQRGFSTRILGAGAKRSRARRRSDGSSTSTQSCSMPTCCSSATDRCTPPAARSSCSGCAAT